MLTTPIASQAQINSQPQSQTAHYLDSSVLNITVTNEDCFFASPHSLLQVQPIIDSSGSRIYKISQYFDVTTERNLYAQSIKQQIKERKIIGRKFCKGIVSISDKDLPFTQTDSTIQNASDGVLLTDKIRHTIANMNMDILQMRKLASKASNGIYSSTQLAMMNTEFQILLSDIDRIAQTATFGRYSLLNGDNPSIHILLNQGSDFISVPTTNLTTGSLGLNISSLEISSQANAQSALTQLSSSFLPISTEYNELSTARHELKNHEKINENTTLIDVTNDDFKVEHHTGPFLVSDKNQAKTQAIVTTKSVPIYPSMGKNTKLKLQQDDCYTAPKECLLCITPSPFKNNSRAYLVEQLCDADTMQLMYKHQYQFKDQLAEGTFFANQFCHGIATISDIQLPFAKQPRQLTDANDGILLVKTAIKAANNIIKQLNDMLELANKGASGIYTPTQLNNLNIEFEKLNNEINQIANTASFNGFLLFDESSLLHIPVSKLSSKNIPVELHNLTTGHSGLNTEWLSILTIDEANSVITKLPTAIKMVQEQLSLLAQTQHELETAAESVSKITKVDLNHAILKVRK